ncbi:BLUF domain-containing protein [Parasphingorhabdus sp.]|uniref:BLUF domain-containing protein n=1 Tax=Parasphingorhabdus sp. TaxID=2709688 RepID=UPI003A8FBD66
MPHRLITSLIYVSTAQPGLSEADFLAIMTVSQRNNQRLGISGLLVFNGSNFMQCLEGERAVANDRLHHIGLDERHSGLTIVSHREAPERQFAEWDMAGQYLPVQEGLAQTGLSKILSGNAVADTTRALFQSFRSLGAQLPGQ